MPSIQDLVVPVVRFTSDRPGAATVTEALGTAFFIDASGTFLTAGSTLRAHGAAKDLGLAVRMRAAHAPFSIVPITDFECADAPWDVAIGQTGAQTQRSFELGQITAAPLLWEPIVCYGCVALERPEPPRAPSPIFHAHAGSVLREIQGVAGSIAPSFDVSFLVSSCLRGAPVFVHERPRAKLVGICVGNGSVGELSYPTAHGDAREFHIESHGIAQDLRALGHWKPRFLLGRTLREIF